jgi:hypothetical protein
MGFEKEEMTGHGFRAMARTILDEVLQFRADFIEHQLGHAVRDPNGRAYNRTAHLAERRKMMQTWADYLDEIIHHGHIVLEVELMADAPKDLTELFRGNEIHLDFGLYAAQKSFVHQLGRIQVSSKDD